MASDLYCSRREVNAAVPAGEIIGPTQLASSALASTDVISLEGHGLETDDEVLVRAIEGGSLPSPLVEGTGYFAIRVSNARFKLAATAGGAAINLSTDGVEVVVMREPAYDDVIEFWSRWADGVLPAELVPLTAPVHPLVRGIVAKLSAKELLGRAGKSSELVNVTDIAAKAMLERYAIGLPLRGAPTVGSANLAVTATAGDADPRGWGAGGTIP